MLKNYLKIAARNLLKHKAYAFINTAGLAVGMTCCLLILLYVQDELSYDRHHENADRIYRVVLEAQIADNELSAPVVSAPMAKALVDEFPEVVQATRFVKSGSSTLFRYRDNSFVEDNVIAADSTIFEVFTIPLLQGDPKTALVEPNSIVLTEEMARKYFGDENPMNQTLAVVNQFEGKVTGVAKSLPANSHFHFNFLVSLATDGGQSSQSWTANGYYTYILLRENYPPEQLEAKFPELVRKYVGPQLKAEDGISFDEFLAAGNRYGFYLQPLTAIHLHSHLGYELEPNGDVAYVYIFSAVAFFILLIACINFMNLATARSAQRAKEVGVRKTLGSSRLQLVRQFLLEAVLLSFVALLLAAMLVELLLPALNQVAGKQLQTDYFGNGLLAAGFAGIALLVGVLAGSYPAFFLSSFRPVMTLKGKLQAGMGSARLRNGLVVFQFAVSIILIVGAAVVFRQLEYVRHKKLGFDKEHVVVIQRAGALKQKLAVFKQELLQHPNVIKASASVSLPGKLFSQSSFQPEGATLNEATVMSVFVVDDQFIETLGIEMAAGRNFSRELLTDSAAVILNESAARRLGWTEAIGKPLTSDDRRYTVIGVVKDFHFESLHQQIRPLLIRLGASVLYMSVRIRPENLASTLAFLKDKWQALVPEQPFEYFFLDSDFDRLYRAEERTGRIFGYFSALAIFIACLGLFGLAAFAAERRTKEIGVRKVLGASVRQIVLLLSKEFTRLIVLAFVVAAPISYFAMNRWLQDFAYRTEINPFIFVLAGLFALVIAWLTVGYQALKAALANPVEALRYE
jgi:putative ABC transport system permease protein